MKQKPRKPPQSKLKPEPFVEAKESTLLRPASEWISLLLCVETYKANVLATAIEQYGIPPIL